ncbi:MAG: GumC family protein, partial [Hyphomicrobium sp.]
MSYDADTEQPEERGGRMSLERVTAAVRRRVALVAAITAIVTATAALVVTLLPNRYDASAIVQIDPRKKSISNMDGVVSDLAATGSTVDSEVEVIRSRAVALKVIELLDLRSDPEFAGPTASENLRSWVTKGGGSEPTPLETKPAPPRAELDPINRLVGSAAPGTVAPERDEVAALFAKRLTVTRVRVTLLMEIRFASADPVKAARIANTVAEVYLADQVEEKTRAASFATDLLEQKLESLKVKVADAEHRVERFKAENNIFDAEGEILSEKQLGQQMNQTISARGALATAKAKYEQVQKLMERGQGSESIAEVLDNDSIKLRKDALATATRREAELETRYGARHPEMQKVRAEIADAKAQLDAEIARVVGNLKNEYEVAAAGEQQITASLSSLKQQQILSKDASVTLKALEREASTEKQLFEALLSRYKQTAETQNLQLPDARIVQRADVPLSPAAPKRKQIVLLALVAGLLAGVMAALALEFGAPGITHPEDIEHTLELQHLSSVPEIDGADGSREAAIRALRMILAEPRGIDRERSLSS